jgi:hypothetical protein
MGSILPTVPTTPRKTLRIERFIDIAFFTLAEDMSYFLIINPDNSARTAVAVLSIALDAAYLTCSGHSAIMFFHQIQF